MKTSCLALFLLLALPASTWGFARVSDWPVGWVNRQQFPYCQCAQDCNFSKYYIEGPTTVAPKKHCWTIKVKNTCPATSPYDDCCSFTLKKFEMLVNSQCLNTKVYKGTDSGITATVKYSGDATASPYPGKVHIYTSTTQVGIPAGDGVLRLSAFNLTQSQATDMEICLDLTNAKPECQVLDGGLCKPHTNPSQEGPCLVTLLDPNTNCCPVGYCPSACKKVKACIDVTLDQDTIEVTNDMCNQVAADITNTLSESMPGFTLTCEDYTQTTMHICGETDKAGSQELANQMLVGEAIINPAVGNQLGEQCQVFDGTIFRWEASWEDVTEGYQDPEDSAKCMGSAQGSQDCKPDYDFPFCPCPLAEGRASTPFKLSEIIYDRPSDTAGYTLYCMTTVQQTPSADSPQYCQEAEKVRKIDFWADQTLKSKLKNFHVNLLAGDGSVVRTRAVKPEWAVPDTVKLQDLAYGAFTRAPWNINRDLWFSGLLEICMELADDTPVTQFCKGPPNAEQKRCVYTIFERSTTDGGQAASNQCCTTNVAVSLQSSP